MNTSVVEARNLVSPYDELPKDAFSTLDETDDTLSPGCLILRETAA